jgi:ABC-type oligopeptide transport system substrate-binding subunit
MTRRQGFAALFVLVMLLAPPVVGEAQTKDDTVVYAIQSDMQNWDPPNSVLRESIILGYHVFDHLAARDLKTGKVGPSQPRGARLTTPPGRSSFAKVSSSTMGRPLPRAT